MALSSFAGGRLWGARYGTSPARVLALHGWERTHSDFDAVLEGMDAIALDLPGFGVSAEPPASWSTREYAVHVAPVLEDMALGPLVVVGHSFGARVAAHLVDVVTTEAPGGQVPARRIAALVLTGAPLAPFRGTKTAKPALAYRAGRALRRAHLLSEERMEQLRQHHGSDDYRRASPLMRGVLVKSVAETAGSAYTEPVMAWARTGGRIALVWGERDGVASLEGTRAALGLGDEAVEVVAAAGHMLGRDLSRALASTVRALAYPADNTGGYPHDSAGAYPHDSAGAAPGVLAAPPSGQVTVEKASD